jgi:hypothetical protein
VTSHKVGEHAVSRRLAVRAAGLAALSAGVAGVATAAPAAAQPGAVSGIVGTWRMRFSPGPGRTDIELIFVFIPGGVFLGLDSPVEPPVGPGVPPNAIEYVGLNAGQWLQLPNGDVQVTTIQLNYDARAVVTSEELSTHLLTYDGASDTIAGTREWRETARDGRLLLSNVGRIEGTRVRVQS